MSNLFRKTSLERISSPEQLNAYIRVSTPSVWLLLAAVVVLLAGVCVWGVFGHMDTTLPALAVAGEGAVTAYVREADAGKIAVGDRVSMEDGTGTVLEIASEPVRAGAALSEYMRHVGGFQAEEWVKAVAMDASCLDGVYAAQIVIDSTAPMAFVLN